MSVKDVLYSTCTSLFKVCYIVLALHLGFDGSPSWHRKCRAESGPLLSKVITGTALFITPANKPIKLHMRLYCRSLTQLRMKICAYQLQIHDN